MGEALALRECPPLEKQVEHTLRVARVVQPSKVAIIDREERRRPCLQPVRATAGFVDSSKHVENVGSLASLEQPVLLVEGVRDAGPAQVPGNFSAFAIG